MKPLLLIIGALRNWVLFIGKSHCHSVVPCTKRYTARRAKESEWVVVEMAEGEEGSLQEAVEESEQPFDPPVEQVNLPDLKQAFYLNGDHIRERGENGELEELGEGAFGRVTKVYWNGLPCAAKELRDDKELLNDENRAKNGFYVESLQLASRLRHPNIVQYIGLWKRPNGNDVILMELLPRKSLTHFLHNTEARIRSIPLRVKRRILIDVCCAMIYLHNLRPCVLHRDLTSNNILLTSDFRAKVTDFGQARFYTDANQEKLTRQPGTKAFMPPEALLPEPKYGKPLDRFSFGCVTLQMLTHKWPNPSVDRGRPRPWEDRRYLLSHPTREERDDFIKPIIIPCLDIIPENRPTFEDIHVTLASGNFFTDDECIRMLDRDIDPASKQNKLPTVEPTPPAVSFNIVTVY